MKQTGLKPQRVPLKARNLRDLLKTSKGSVSEQIYRKGEKKECNEWVLWTS
jgi:hypothetical protein